MPFHLKLSILLAKTLSIFMVLMILLGFVNPLPVSADGACTLTATPDVSTWTTATKPTDITNITIGSPGTLAEGGDAKFHAYLIQKNSVYLNPGGTTAQNNQISFTPKNAQDLFKEGSHTIVLKDTNDSRDGHGATICSVTYTVRAFNQLQCSLISTKNTGSSYGPGENVQVNGTFWFLDVNGNKQRQKMKVDLRLWYQQTKNEKQQVDSQTNDQGDFSNNEIKIPNAINSGDVGWWRISASKNNPDDSEKELCSAPIYVSQQSGETPSDGPPKGTGHGSVKNPCAGGSCETALGNISTDPSQFISKILTIAIGLAGGIALIFMVIGSIKVLTSSGDQQKLTGGKDMIVAAVAGLLFLIFSVLILRFIGNNLLGGVPGL